jgi:hypothetical protein
VEQWPPFQETLPKTLELELSWPRIRWNKQERRRKQMDYVNLGKTGLKVSRLCLGCMTYGAPEKGSHAWALHEEQSRPFIQKALELGITFFDTANVYSGGASEEVLGRALRDFARRDEVVAATKVYGIMRPNHPNGRGLSRKAILTHRPLPRHRSGRQSGGGSLERDRQRARTSTRPGGVGLAVAEAGGDGAHRGSHETPPPGGRGRRPLGQIIRRGDQDAGGALHSASLRRI